MKRGTNDDNDAEIMVCTMLCVYRYKQRGSLPVFVGTLLRASQQCCGKKSQPMDTGNENIFLIKEHQKPG